ncbi:MAG: hypothetical protein LBN08_01240 [Lactobacillales bacterium]|jgi:hypothetical protein|nr:hypothetical protein [Lactobacillales bacterium]
MSKPKTMKIVKSIEYLTMVGVFLVWIFLTDFSLKSVLLLFVYLYVSLCVMDLLLVWAVPKIKKLLRPHR